MPYFPPAPAPTAPAGNSGDVQFAGNGNSQFAADSNFNYDPATASLFIGGAIFGVTGQNPPAIDMVNGVIYDSGFYPSLNWVNRLLQDGGGVQVADWGQSALYDASVVIAIDWRNRILYDSAIETALNWETGELKPNRFTVNSKTIDPPVLTVKTTDESVTSSTALQDDDDLQFGMNASATWEFEILAFVSAGALGGIKATMNGPASPSNVIYTTEILKLGLVVAAGIQVAYGTTQTDVGGTLYAVRIAGTVINGANAGAVVLQWAQNTSNGTATKVLKGSYIKARRVG